MKPGAFDMHRPHSLEAALSLLAQHGDSATLIAGGQSLVPMMNLRIAEPAMLIDLNLIAGLDGIWREGEMLRIGATTRQQTALDSELVQQHVPLLSAALRHVGHYSTRSRGTVGGSLAFADPSSEIALASLILGAQFTLRRAGGQRVVAADDFFLDALQTALGPDEILTEVALPIAPAGTRVAFREHARRHGDFAITSAAAQLSLDGSLRVGIGAVGPTPVVCGLIQEAHSRGDLLANLDQVVRDEINGIDAVDDVHTSASYRRTLAAVCLGDCIRELIA